MLNKEGWENLTEPNNEETKPYKCLEGGQKLLCLT